MAWQVKIHTLDVKQGDCSIIEAWDRDEDAYAKEHQMVDNPTEMDLKKFALKKGRYQAVLIDGGQLSVLNVFILRDYIEEKEVIITKAILTHFDSDHYNGLDNLFALNKSAMALYRTDCCLRIFHEFDYVFTELIPIDIINYEIKRKIIKGILIYNNVLWGSTSCEVAYGGLVINYNDDIRSKEPELRRLIKLILMNIINSTKVNLNYNKKITEILRDADANPKDLLILEDTTIYNKPTLRNNQGYIDRSHVKGAKFKQVIKPPILTDLSKIIIQQRFKIVINGTEKFLCKISMHGMFGRYSDNIIGFNPEVWKVTNQTEGGMTSEKTFYLGDDLLWETVTFADKKTTDSFEKRPYLFIVNCGKAFSPTGNELTATNASSLGLFLIFDQFTFLTAGDLEDNSNLGKYPNENYETRLAQSLNSLGYNRITGMKCGHHGGENATNDTVLKALNPKFAIISCGKGPHGHPKENTLYRLNKYGSVQYVFLTNCMQRYGVKQSYYCESTHKNYPETKIDEVVDNVFQDLYGLLSNCSKVDIKKDIFNNNDRNFCEWIKSSITQEVKDSFLFGNNFWGRYIISSYEFIDGKYRFYTAYPIEGYYYQIKNYNHATKTPLYSNFKRQFMKAYMAGDNGKDLHPTRLKYNGNYLFEVGYNQFGSQECQVSFYALFKPQFNLRTINISLINAPLLIEKNTQTMRLSTISLPAPFDNAFQYFLEFLPDKHIANIDDNIQPIDNILIIDYAYQDKEWLWKIDDLTYLDISINKFHLKIINDLTEQNVRMESSLLAKITKSGYNNKVIILTADFNPMEYQPYWKFYPQSNDVAKNFNFLDLFNLILNNDSLLFIPDDLKFITTINEKLIIKEFYLKIYPNDNIKTQCHIEVEYECNLEIIPNNKLSLEKIGINADLTTDSYSTLLYGDFQIKEKTVELGIGMSTNEYWYGYIKGKTQDGKEEGPLPGLIDMANWLGGFDETELGNSLTDISPNFSFNLTDIRVELNMKTKAVRFLAVDSILIIKSLRFNIATTLLPELRVYGRLDTTTPVNIEQALSDFGLGCPFQSDMTITEASIDAYPKGKFYKINLGVGNVATIHIGGKELKIDEVDFQIVHSTDNFSGYLDAILVVKPAPEVDEDDEPDEPIAFELRAAYEDKHWTFDGQLNGDIKLEEFITWLTDKCGIPKDNIPTWLQNLHLTHAGIAFSTDGSYSFDLGLLAPLAEVKQGEEQDEAAKNLVLSFSINKNPKKELPDLSAQIIIGNQEFDIDMGGSEGGTILIASYHPTDESTISLQDICDSIGLGEITIPDGVNAEFNHAELEYHFGSDKAPKLLKISLSNRDKYNITFLATQTKKAGATAFSGWLYGFSIGINQVQIHLDGLPLIGEQLADVGLGVKDIKAVLLSKSITKEEAATPELSDLHLPTGEDITGWGKATLCCNLQVLNETYPVVLTMGVEKEEKAKDKTTLIRMEAGEDGVYTVADEPAKSNAARISWKKIDKKAGPFRLNKIGFAFEEQLLQLHIDVAMMAGPVSIGFNDLWLASPLTTFDATVGLDAVSVSYISNFLKIDGSFRKMHDAENTYAGSAMIGIKKVNIGAMGVYAKKDGQTSMFIYAMMTDPPLGGDPTFYVTGLALGFGYNRDLVLPDVNQVKQYPLITPFIKGRSADPNKEISETDLPSVALNKLITQGIVPVEIGEQWIAAGVRFTTYKLINSFGLLSVKFGNRLEIGLTALSVIATPTTNNPLVYAELAIDARILPDEGLVAVNAKLTAESFIFEKDCKITGGFALYTWFGDNPNAGDFVVTLGGYHPRFNVPAHYPQVPRLGFNWQVTESLTLKGDLYYALTSSCIMAGGRLEARYESGKLKAWFIIGADFILSWKPYYYEADMYLSFGVSYRLGGETIGKTISASFSAQLRIWGPDFSGVAEIDLFVISVTVRFGEADQGSKPITWKEFKGSFLPPLCAGKTENTPENYTDSYLKVAMVSGIKIEQATSEEKPAKDIKLLQHNIVFETTTIIPAKQISAGNYADKYDKQVTIGMTGNKSLSTSDLTITMTKEGTPYTIRKKPNETGNPEERQYFEITPIRSNLSAALWDKKVEDISAAKDTVVRDLLTGIRFEAKVKNPDEGFSIEKWKLMFAHGTPFEVKLPKQTKVFDTSKVADLRNLTEDSTLRKEMLDAFKLNGLVEKNAVVDFSSRVAYVLKGKPKAEAMW